MLEVLRRAAATVLVSALMLLCCLAWAVGVLVLSSGTAEARPKRPARGSHHGMRRHSPRPHHARQRKVRARRPKPHVRRAQRLSAERRRRERVVRLAWREVGVPYRWGGGSPRACFDCSGLTQWVYRHVGGSSGSAAGSPRASTARDAFSLPADPRKRVSGSSPADLDLSSSDGQTLLEHGNQEAT
jgi:hypothetical protein